MPELAYPPKPRPGDRVAVLSPSAGLPGLFPLPFEVGLTRLRGDFGLIPVEYPGTRTMGATPAARAADLHAAFADPDITAVISSIGGEDQITVLPHLDPELIRAHPKPFFGYSDNTCLLAWLWQHGIVGFHGGSVMCEFGRPGAMHPLTAASLRAALFTSGPFTLTPAEGWTDQERDWNDQATFATEPPLRPGDGWSWHGGTHPVSGPAWGGNIEVLAWLLMAGIAIPDPADVAGGILFLETSEDQPAPAEVYYILRSMGERGLLQPFSALLFARPKAWSLDRRTTPAEQTVYKRDLHAAVLRAVAEYNPHIPVVLNIDFGHTDPQQIIPNGGHITLTPNPAP